MTSTEVIRVRCPLCERFVGEGRFSSMRFPCRCKHDVLATLTADGGVLIKAEPRVLR